MSKLFSEKLNNLEQSVVQIEQINYKLTELDNRFSNTETKINQIIEEIQPILTSHANALKELLANLKSKQVKE